LKATPAFRVRSAYRELGFRGGVQFLALAKFLFFASDRNPFSWAHNYETTILDAGLRLDYFRRCRLRRFAGATGRYSQACGYEKTGGCIRGEAGGEVFSPDEVRRIIDQPSLRLVQPIDDRVWDRYETRPVDLRSQTRIIRRLDRKQTLQA